MNVRSQDIGDLPAPDLFVGQIVAVRPLSALAAEQAEDSLVSAVLAGSRQHSRDYFWDSTARRQSFSLLTYAAYRGILSLGHHEIDVSVEPLEPATPLDAAVFRIISLSGRSLTIAQSGTPPGPDKN